MNRTATILSLALALPLAGGFPRLLLGGGLARAETSDAKPAKEATADVKACTTVENHKPKDEAKSFKKGDTVIVWSEIRGANGKEALHVWKKGGKDHNTAPLPIGSVRWPTQSPSATAPPA